MGSSSAWMGSLFLRTWLWTVMVMLGIVERVFRCGSVSFEALCRKSTSCLARSAPRVARCIFLQPPPGWLGACFFLMMGKEHELWLSAAGRVKRCERQTGEEMNPFSPVCLKKYEAKKAQHIQHGIHQPGAETLLCTTCNLLIQ